MSHLRGQQSLKNCYSSLVSTERGRECVRAGGSRTASTPPQPPLPFTEGCQTVHPSTDEPLSRGTGATFHVSRTGRFGKVYVYPSDSDPKIYVGELCRVGALPWTARPLSSPVLEIVSSRGSETLKSVPSTDPRLGRTPKVSFLHRFDDPTRLGQRREPLPLPTCLE